jgi:hypothetical protein
VKENILVPVRNVLLLSEAIEQMSMRRPDSGIFVLVQGPAGTGKTSTARMLAKQRRGLYYSVPEGETHRSFLSGVVNALNGWSVDMPAQALRNHLLADLEHRNWPPLLLDEADRLDVTRNQVNLLEVVRDIHDRGRSPIVLFSIAHLARRLANPTGGDYAEAFSSRVAVHIKFESASLEDCELLAECLLEGVKFDGDLIVHCLAASGGSFRPLLGLYAEIEQLAKTAGIDKIGLRKYEQLRSFAGLPAAAPARRAKSSTAEPERPKKAVA